jgi:hypothetical protein
MTRAWIASGLRIGSASYVSHLLSKPWPRFADTFLSIVNK